MKTQESSFEPASLRFSSPASLRWISAIEVLVLAAAGISLFFLPQWGRSRWVWEITPYNTVFLGAIYLAALVPVGLLAIRRQAPIRLILSMQLLFTAILLAASLGYLDRFNLLRKLVRGWFFLYTTIPTLSIFYLWRYRRLASSFGILLPSRWQICLIVQSVLLGLYGIGLLIAPEWLSGFWPWKIDGFHGRLYSAAFLTPALGAWLLVQSASAIEQLTLGLMQLGLGVLPILGVTGMDRSLHRINWLLPGTWLWIGIFALEGLVGLGLVQHAHKDKQHEA